jgi:hypothetical protein
MLSDHTSWVGWAWEIWCSRPPPPGFAPSFRGPAQDRKSGIRFSPVSSAASSKESKPDCHAPARPSRNDPIPVSCATCVLGVRQGHTWLEAARRKQQLPIAPTAQSRLARLARHAVRGGSSTAPYFKFEWTLLLLRDVAAAELLQGLRMLYGARPSMAAAPLIGFTPQGMPAPRPLPRARPRISRLPQEATSEQSDYHSRPIGY